MDEDQSETTEQVVKFPPKQQSSLPVTCGTAAGLFTFAFARPIAKLFTSWSDTTRTRVAGALSWFAATRRPDTSARTPARYSFFLFD
jgi:hypothetical protein